MDDTQWPIVLRDLKMGTAHETLTVAPSQCTKLHIARAIRHIKAARDGLFTEGK